MEISDQLRCLFSGRVERQGDAHVVEIPERELSAGEISDGETYRVAVLSTSGDDVPTDEGEAEPGDESLRPPVEEGETRTVEIETIGDQGDGIARVERGYVVIVPETDAHERVEIEIQDVQQNVAFAEVVERKEYYE